MTAPVPHPREAGAAEEAAEEAPGAAGGADAAAAPGPVPFFGIARENAALEAALLPEFRRVLLSGEMVNNADVQRFEAQVAATAGRTHAVATGSGTDALAFALIACGIGPGDAVLVPDFTFLASASAILRIGARPVFVDMRLGDPDRDEPSCLPDLADAARRLTPQTRGMVWVGLFGGMGDPAPVAAFARRHGLVLVEDAAQNFGAGWGPARAGGLGEAAIFSFDRFKVLAAPGTGGAAVTDSPVIAERLRALRYHGVLDGEFRLLGFNSQLPALAAAALNVKLRHHPDWVARRAAIAAAYDAALAPLPVTRLRWPAATRHVWHKYVLLTPEAPALARHLAAAGIPTRRHYARPLHAEPVFAGLVAPDSRFPGAERLAAEALSLPIHAQLTPAEVARVAAALAAFFR
jgi:dTDP-4-amino-4,6-dideoxygalactose transaminase